MAPPASSITMVSHPQLLHAYTNGVQNNETKRPPITCTFNSVLLYLSLILSESCPVFLSFCLSFPFSLPSVFVSVFLQSSVSPLSICSNVADIVLVRLEVWETRPQTVLLQAASHRFRRFRPLPSPLLRPSNFLCRRYAASGAQGPSRSTIGRKMPGQAAGSSRRGYTTRG